MPDARELYKHFQPIATRWNDNDVYGHVNNIEYYGYRSTRRPTPLPAQLRAALELIESKP